MSLITNISGTRVIYYIFAGFGGDGRKQVGGRLYRAEIFTRLGTGIFKTLVQGWVFGKRRTLTATMAKSHCAAAIGKQLK